MFLVPKKDPGKAPMKRSRFRVWCRRLIFYPLVILAMLAGSIALFLWWTRPSPLPPTQIFQGVTYECRELPTTGASEKLAQLFTIDLQTPGLELWINPRDPNAKSAGGQYFTQWFPSVARERKLSVLVNATLFAEVGASSRFPGTPANTIETLVSDGEVTKLWKYSRIIWFEKDLTPHVIDGDPKLSDLTNAKWAVSGQTFSILDNKPNPYADPRLDRRTCVGVNLTTRMFYIGVFDAASVGYASKILQDLGATHVTSLDGGTSTGMAIGPGAQGVRPGTYIYPLRAIPTFFGINAPPLR